MEDDQDDEINEIRPINIISEEEQIAHLRNMFDGDNNTMKLNNQLIVDMRCNSKITEEYLQKILPELRNRKVPGMDGNVNEMLKYGEQALQY